MSASAEKTAGRAKDDQFGELLRHPPGRWALVGMFLILVGHVLVIAQSLLVPVLGAVFLTLMASPVRRALQRAGLPAPVAAAGIMAAVVLVLGAVGYSAAGTLNTFLDDTENLASRVAERLEVALGLIEPVIEAGEQIETMAQDPVEEETVVVREEGPLALATQATPAVMAQLALALVLALFLIGSGDLIYEKIVQSTPKIQDKKKALSMARDIEKQISRYFFTVTLINAGVAVLVGFSFWALGMPEPVLFGALAFLVNFIPYIGPLVGIGIAFLVGVLTYDGVLPAILPAAVYWAINTMEGQLVTPVLVGRRLKLNAIVVFLSVAIWGWFWSIAGMLLATPILIAVKVIADNIEPCQPIGRFLGPRATPTERERILLAHVLNEDGAKRHRERTAG